MRLSSEAARAIIIMTYNIKPTRPAPSSVFSANIFRRLSRVRYVFVSSSCNASQHRAASNVSSSGSQRESRPVAYLISHLGPAAADHASGAGSSHNRQRC